MLGKIEGRRRDKIVDRVMLACKLYCIKYITPTGEEYEKCKIRGIPENAMTPTFLKNRMKIFKDIVDIQRNPRRLVQWYKEHGRCLDTVAEIEAEPDDCSSLIDELVEDLMRHFVEKLAKFDLHRMKRTVEHMNSTQKKRGIKPYDIYWDEQERSLLKSVYGGRKVLDIGTDWRVRDHWLPTVPNSWPGDVTYLSKLSWSDYISHSVRVSHAGWVEMRKTSFKDSMLPAGPRRDLIRAQLYYEMDGFYPDKEPEGLGIQVTDEKFTKCPRKRQRTVPDLAAPEYQNQQAYFDEFPEDLEGWAEDHEMGDMMDTSKDTVAPVTGGKAERKEDS